jgi:lipoprotein-anchoring transpeptidase ErfK/SrfK
MVNNQNNKPQQSSGQQPPYEPSQPIIPRPQQSQPNQPVQGGQSSRIVPQQSQHQSTIPQPYDPRRQSQPMPSRKNGNDIGEMLRGVDKRVWYIGGGLTALAAFLCAGMVGLLVLFYVSQPRVAQGVRVAGIEVGGETLEDAQAAIERGYASQPITLTDVDRSWQVPLNELGITVDSSATLALAETAAEGSVVQPVYQIDFAQAQAKLIAMSVDVNIPAVNGNPPIDGKSLDIPFLLDRLRIDLAAEIADGILDLPMIETEGQYDLESDYTGVPVTHVVAAGEELGLISKKYDVSMQDIINLNNLENPDLLWVGQELIIPAAGVYTPTQQDAPPAPVATGKSILISTQNQRIYAYENGQLVRSHLVSTGTSATPTVLGDYRIQYKFEADDMQGADYFLPQVPWTMYFYQGYAIHGTYWHNSFGRPMSHGCVNLPVDEAKWFFDWADMGTPIRVI